MGNEDWGVDCGTPPGISLAKSCHWWINFEVRLKKPKSRGNQGENAIPISPHCWYWSYRTSTRQLLVLTSFSVRSWRFSMFQTLFFFLFQLVSLFLDWSLHMRGFVSLSIGWPINLSVHWPIYLLGWSISSLVHQFVGSSVFSVHDFVGISLCQSVSSSVSRPTGLRPSLNACTRVNTLTYKGLHRLSTKLQSWYFFPQVTSSQRFKFNVYLQDWYGLKTDSSVIHLSNIFYLCCHCAIIYFILFYSF